jgi:undecaprenyl diphosphate synthase
MVMDDGQKIKGQPGYLVIRNAIKAVRDTAESCAELGIRYLTLYAFSTENWSRPKDEINALMQLLVSTIRGETQTLMKNNIRLKAIGNIEICLKFARESCRKPWILLPIIMA